MPPPAGPSRADRAMLFAMEILRSTISDNTLAVVANSQRLAALMSWYQHNAATGGGGAGGAGGGGPAAPTPPGAMPPVPGMPVATTPKIPRANPVIVVPPPRATPVPTAPNPLGQIGKNVLGQAGLGGTGAVSSVVGKLGPLGAIAAPLLSVLEKVAGKFLSILGPMAILDQMMQSTSSGFGVLQQSVKLFAGTLAPVLLPATVLLSAGFVALAEFIEEEGGPALEAWTDLVLQEGVPALEQFCFYLKLAAAGAESTAMMLRTLGEFTPGAMSGRPDPMTGAADRRRADSSVSMVLQSLRASMGPRASISGLGEVGKQAQQAALQGDPIELRIQRDMLRALENIERGVNRRRERAADPGRSFDPIPAVARAARATLAEFFDDIFG